MKRPVNPNGTGDVERRCRVEDCTNRYRSRDYCLQHLNEAKAAGEDIVDYRKSGPLPDVKCRIDGCENSSRYRVKELCGMHYQRLRKYGAAELPENPTVPEILEANRPANSTGCWEWGGAVSTSGYGRIGDSGYVHRVAYEVYTGPIPAGYQIDHLCRNTICFNPDHIEAVTPQENLRRQSEFIERDATSGRIVGAKRTTSPSCRDLKHLNCSGDAWNDFTNSPTKCQCLCHESLGEENQ